MSVLRLVFLGERFADALQSWQGADGDAVREAAFSKEVSRLNLLEARVLLCAAYLAYTSPVELSSLLGAVQAPDTEITRYTATVLHGFDRERLARGRDHGRA